MDQLPPDSHWATVSHSEAVAAEALPAAISGAAMATPVTPASAATRVALDGLRRFTRRLFPYGRWQDSALRQPGLVVTSGDDRRQGIRGISKTIRASETHP